MTDPEGKPSKPAPRKAIQAPKGTRDFYPADMLRRRYITDAWRRVSLRHGFEEIDGPTFETAELYAVKSGEGILGEMFGVYSGKSPEDVEQVKQGMPPFGLRPEFTPTLARMYAARAKQLPQPTKWFSVGNYFRAERPQRGRLREFWQWNADVIGGDATEEDRRGYDAEIITLVTALYQHAGMADDAIVVQVNDRQSIVAILLAYAVPDSNLDRALAHLDKVKKQSPESWHAAADAIGIPMHLRLWFGAGPITIEGAQVQKVIDELDADFAIASRYLTRMRPLLDLCEESGVSKNSLCSRQGIVRGLAYYTGMVFESFVSKDKERAVAGGGRYDNLIELFGGPPTPAVGFGMGDVVLGNLLDDHKLIPEGSEMLRALARPMPYRPDGFIVCPSEDAEAQREVIRLCARLRRGVERDEYTARAQAWNKDADPAQHPRPWDEESRYVVPPLHARRSYKSTRNLGKLLQDASACHARFAVIVESSTHVTLKNLDSGEQTKDVPLDQVGAKIAAKPN